MHFEHEGLPVVTGTENYVCQKTERKRENWKLK